MRTISNTFSDGRRFLLGFKARARIETSDGERTSNAAGEAIILVHGNHQTNRGLSLVRFGFACSSVDAKKGPTGVVTVSGRSAGGILQSKEQELLATIEVVCEVNYESLDRAQVRDMDRGDYYIPAKEPAAGRLSARLLETRNSLMLENCRIEVVCAAGGFGEIQLIVIELDPTPLLPLPPMHNRFKTKTNGNSVAFGDSNIDENICIQVNKSRIIVQPVGFQISASDPSPSGSTATAQLNKAQEVWGKSCIDIQVNPIVLITDATLKTSSDLTAIRAAYSDPDPNVIEVFFVANSLPTIGGGSAGGIGLASCKPVIAEPNSGDPVLVSHELGHVLGLLHPGPSSNSDAGTVMAPTGSAMNPGTEFVTYYMCTNISNPVLQTLVDLCCLTHDIGDHYIRDFPVDVGAEPSEPLPAGMTRYSMSNAWNRLTNTPGSYSPSTGPEHEQPVRFNADMTAKTNYLFATVEQVVNLKVRNAVVKFSIKNPGSGGGATNLMFIGQVSVPDALAVGNPQTVSIPWTLPSGTPQHSCIFAVVRSDGEQEGDQTGLDWWQFEDLSRNDNDWAQRNLDIEDFGSGNIGEDNNVESAPLIIRIPPQAGYRQLQLDLDVDAREAAGLTGLTLEVPGKEQFKLKPGEELTITPKTPIVPGQEVIVVVQAIIPGGLPVGRSFIVKINPIVGDRRMVGYACEFRANRPSRVIAQLLDATAAAYADLSEFAELPFAHRMVKELRALLRDPPYSLVEMAGVLLQFEGIIKAGESEIKKVQVAQKFGLIDAMTEWRRMAAQFKNGKISSLALVEAFRRISNRSLTTAFLLGEGPRLPSPAVVQVVLDRTEIAYDRDLLGPGEFYFLSEVESEDGHVVRRRLPEKGHYIVDAGWKAATLQLDVSLYEGEPGNALRIRLEGREVDCFGIEQRLCTYERKLKGGPDSIRGSYVPGDEEKDLENLKDWRIFYRIV